VPFVVSVYGDGRPQVTAEAGFSRRTFPWKPIVLAIMALAALAIGLYAFTRTDVESQATRGETTTIATTTTAAAETTTTAAQETTTTAPPDDGGGDDAPLGDRLDQPQVLFASDRDGDFDLLIANEDGSDAVAVTDNDVFDADPTFSPDGNEAIFVSARDGNNDLFRLNLDDCNPSDPATCQPDRLTATEEDERFPDVSPDGDLVVFARNVADPSSRDTDFDLFVIDLESGNEEPLATLPGDQSRPQFSPNGDLVAFDSAGRGGLVVSVVDQAGTVTTVGQAPGFDIKSPQWVDDDTLVFVRTSGDVGELVQVDLGSRTAGLPLFDEPGLDLFAISPDGDRIVFQSDDNLFVADLDGGDAEQLTRDQGFNFQADLFQPD
jgi:Tol biopolymer transport system component